MQVVGTQVLHMVRTAGSRMARGQAQALTVTQTANFGLTEDRVVARVPSRVQKQRVGLEARLLFFIYTPHSRLPRPLLLHQAPRQTIYEELTAIMWPPRSTVLSTLRPAIGSSIGPSVLYHRPPFIRRNSFPERLLTGQQVVGLRDYDNHVLHRYLPNLSQLVLQYGTPAKEITKRLVYDSDGVEENGGFEGLTATELLDAYDDVIKATRQATTCEDASVLLLRAVNNVMAEEEVRSGGLRRERYGQSLLWFRGLAEVSRQTQSIYLGRLLYEVFLANGGHLLRHGRLETSAQWCYAVCRSVMDPKDMTTCLRLLTQMEPGLMDFFRQQPDAESHDIARMLHRCADYLDAGGLARGRSLGRAEWHHHSRLYSPSRSRDRLGSRWLNERSPDRWSSRWLAGRSPDRYDDRLLTDGRRDDVLIRPRSAPGHRWLIEGGSYSGSRRTIERQAENVMVVADTMRYEADKLRQLAER